MASPRDFAASIATCRFSFSFFWPINSLSSCGRSFNSNDESSSTGAADTRRSRFGVRLGLLLAAAIDSDSRTKCETAQSLMRTESKSCRQDSLSYLFIICHSERSAVVIPILKPLLIRSLNLFHSEPKPSSFRALNHCHSKPKNCCHSERSEEPAFRRYPAHRRRQRIPHGKTAPFGMTTFFGCIEYSHRCLTAPSVPSYAVWISHCEAFYGSQP